MKAALEKELSVTSKALSKYRLDIEKTEKDIRNMKHRTETKDHEYEEVCHFFPVLYDAP